jgi:hypothetical protein
MKKQTTAGWHRASALVSVLILSGCASKAPWSEISGQRDVWIDSYSEPIDIVAVDGRMNAPGTKVQQVEPGQRVVILASARRSMIDQRLPSTVRPSIAPLQRGTTVSVDAKPCVRYSFMARHESSTQLQPWQLVLTMRELIPHCISQFPDAVPAGVAAQLGPTPVSK